MSEVPSPENLQRSMRLTKMSPQEATEIYGVDVVVAYDIAVGRTPLTPSHLAMYERDCAELERMLRQKRALVELAREWL